MAGEIFLRKTPKFLGKLAATLLIAGTPWLFAPSFAAAEPEKSVAKRYGRSTGLPVPRFASIKADIARLRRGPGVDYPILWDIKRRGLPVRIIGEYGPWRRLELHDGTRGWMHRVLLSGRRTALLLGDKRRIRAEPYEASQPLATVDPETPLRLDECVRGWCTVESGGVRGWAPIASVWGAQPQRKAGGA